MIDGGVEIGAGLVCRGKHALAVSKRRRIGYVLLFYHADRLGLWRRVEKQRHIMSQQTDEDLSFPDVALSVR